MPVYVFRAKIPGGKLVKGEVEAGNETEARVKIRAQNLVPVQLIPKGAKLEPPKFLSSFSSGVSSKELQVMTRQFATLINSGIPVVQSIEILEEGSKNMALRKALSAIKNEISSGRRLAEAMAKQKHIFDKLYINLVGAGEEGGILDVILNRLAIYIEKAEKIKNKVKSAMWYPAIVISISVVVIAVIMTFVIPQFEELFASTGKELPELTQMVINASHFFQSYWYLIILSLVALFIAFKQYYSTPSGRETIDELLIRSPIIGSVIEKAEIAKFSRTLSTMLSSGVALLDALDIASESVGNAVMEKTLKQARVVLQEGKSIVIPFSKNPYVPDMVTQMIGVGEQTGAIDQMLAKVADFYEDEVDYTVNSATSMIEPLMLVFLGGMIAILVIAMYLPIFDIAGAV